MDANKLFFKITEKHVNVKTAEVLHNKISKDEEITICDAIIMKKLLGLSNDEAIDIFLSWGANEWKHIDLKMQQYVYMEKWTRND